MHIILQEVFPPVLYLRRCGSNRCRSEVPSPAVVVLPLAFVVFLRVFKVMGEVRGDRGQGYREAMSQSLPSSPRSFAEECSGRDKLRGAPRLKNQKRLSKQLSMRETPRDVAWEKRRRQMLRQGRMAARSPSLLHEYPDDITYEDLNELKGCIDLGFGFKEEDKQLLANTLPALDIYFAVNRQLTTGSAASTLRSLVSSLSSSSLGGQSSSSELESWKICNPGDDPQQVKTKLRHWAQAVAFFMRQSL